MQYEVPMDIPSSKDLSMKNPCFSQRSPDCQTLSIGICFCENHYSLSRTFGTETLLSFLVISPENKGFKFGTKSWRLGIGPEMDDREETSLQLFVFFKYLESQILPEGEPSQGSIWCSAAQTFQVEELICQEQKLKYILSAAALR